MDDSILKLKNYLKVVPGHIKNLSKQDWIAKPNPEKWSKQEILGHLVDSAIYNLERFTKIRFASKPFEIISYAQAELVKANDYQNAAPDHLLTLWKTLNRQILNIWETYSEEELEFRVSIPYLEKEVSLLWWINDYVEHMEHHLKQIFESLDAVLHQKQQFEAKRVMEGITYTISTDPRKLDRGFIHDFLSHSYWAEGRSKASVNTSIAHSLNFGLYKGDKQIGFARVVTDFAVTAYLADVFILEAHRGNSLGQWLIQTVLENEPLQNIKKWVLHTKDAHGLYRKFGFKPPENPGHIMERS